ncbi:hypothetical protein QBC34DRAFT_437889 [Podospora aff. communis PSN243]|uniref:Apple domain-containing protein n=1 Tax=Podospora aff. communis PSN243 TaxID=3040156 RepID=A0AAV9GPF1_9PEZI|nr:hypothetical protein QBC34DRAFT_437889 [Podospora aff. communis PSN243]
MECLGDAVQYRRVPSSAPVLVNSIANPVFLSVFRLQLGAMYGLSRLASAVVAGASLSTALGGVGPFCGEQCGKALGYFAGSCRTPFPPTCFDSFHSQAVEFCSSYLSLTATSLATATGFTTVTVTETDTVESTVVETSTTTTDTTTTEISTSITLAVSTTTTTSYIPPPIVTVTVKRRGGAPASCPDLSTRTSWLTRRPSKLSSLCSRLGVTATTVASTSTAISTATSSDATTTTELTTSTTLEISTSIATFTSTTVTTSSTVATSIATVDYCDASLAVSLENDNSGAGNVVLTPGGISDANECCRLCWSTLDCVASAFTAVGQCQLLVKSDPGSGGPATAQCPLGVDEVIVYVPGGGNVFRGPCGPLL